MRDLKTQFVSALLFILTVAAVCCAVINFRHQKIDTLPEDGAIWVDRTAPDGQDVVQALHVTPGGEADNAGIRAGDILLEISGNPIHKSIDVPRVLQQIGSWSQARYQLRRGSVQLPAQVVIGERVPDRAIYYQYGVGVVYLLIGLFVYYRRVSAPRSVHFYVLCLLSFILSCFHYTGKLNAFDESIYWGNVAASIFAPTVFLHFCLVFPDRVKWLARRGSAWLLYLPGAFLLAVYFLIAKGMLRVAASPIEVNWFLDRAALLFLTEFICWARWCCLSRRQGWKILWYAVSLSTCAMALCWGWCRSPPSTPSHTFWVPYRIITSRWQCWLLILVPITWAYAILRYRLMDVDIIFQQGYVYTLATLVVLGIFYGLIFSFTRPEDISPVAIVGLILFATFIFQPIRDWLQEQLDRYFFYKDRYDYRRTLIEFARELGSETNLDEMLRSVADRLIHTLSIQHVAFFLVEEGEEQFHMHMALGTRKERQKQAQELDLSFLSTSPGRPYLFFERTRRLLDVVSHEWPISVRSTIADLDLTYYLPCTVRGRTIAYLALSRTDKGDFLSTDDVELLTTLSGSVSIAIENARLYRSLQRKVDEYERLKEFSENIVESINVGILAADLEDRVESWNTQIERLTGTPRQAAVGRRLADLLPADLCESVRAGARQLGVHNIYKFVLQPSAGPMEMATGTATEMAVLASGAHLEHRHRSAGVQRYGADRAADHFRRHYGSRRAGAATGAGRQAELHRAAGGRRGA